MIAKIAVLFAVIAVASAGVLVQTPAATAPLATQVLTYAAAPAYGIHHHQIAPVGLVHAPAPVAVHAVPAPYTIATGARVVQTYEPVEQHGYKIAY